MAWTDIRFIAWARNLVSDVDERLGKTDDARHALNVADQHAQPLTDAQLRASPVSVAQGAAGATPWPVDIGGATVSVSNLQQLSVVTNIEETAYDLADAAYSEAVPFAADSLLGTLALRFTTTQPRTITVAADDGRTLVSLVDDTSLTVTIDFEDEEIDSGSTITVAVTQTVGACSMAATMTSKIGTAALGGNPVLGAGTSYIGQVGIAAHDSASGDAFGRLRVSNPFNEFEVHHQYDLAPLFVGETADSTGTVTHAPPAARLTVGPGEIVKHQSHYYPPYQAGKGRLVRLTATPRNMLAGIRWAALYGDDDDAVGFQRSTAGVMQVLLRSSTVAGFAMDQSSWNIDKLDGNGPSGLNITQTEWDGSGLHFVVDLEWLSIGRVRWAVNTGGLIAYVHAYDSAFDTTRVGSYMRTASLPVRWEIQNTNGAGADGVLDAVCATVISEGGHEPSGLLWCANNPAKVAVGASLTPLLSIRPRATLNGLANHGSLLPNDLTVLADSDDIMVEVYIAGTVTGTWTKVDATTSPAADGSSHAEWCVPTALSGGRKIAAFPVAAGSGSAAGGFSGRIGNDLLLFVASDGYQLPITICARRLGGAADAVASVQWIETR